MRRGPLRHPWFRAFISAVGLGSVGTEISRLAMPLMVLDITHSLPDAALFRILQLVPYVFFGALAGALIDRFEKRRLLIAANLAGMALTASIPLAAAAGIFSLPMLYAVGFGLGAVEVVWGVTADFSVVPALVEPRELTAANAAYLGADRAARIVGPALGGVAIAALGGGIAGDAGALWLAAAAFLAPLAIVWRMPPVYETEGLSTSLTVRNVAAEIGESFAFIWRSPILRALVGLMFISNVGGGPGIQTLLLFVLKVEHGLDAATIGLALSLAGAVQILGSLAAPVIARGRPLGHTMLVVVAVASVGAFAAGLARDWRFIVAAVAARQTAWAAHIVYVFLPRQREVPAALRGRVNGSFRTIILVGNSASPALLSTIQASLGSSAAFFAAGALGLAAVALTYFSPLRRYDVREPEELARVEGAAEAEPNPAD